MHLFYNCISIPNLPLSVQCRVTKHGTCHLDSDTCVTGLSCWADVTNLVLLVRGFGVCCEMCPSSCAAVQPTDGGCPKCDCTPTTTYTRTSTRTTTLFKGTPLSPRSTFSATTVATKASASSEIAIAVGLQAAFGALMGLVLIIVLVTCYRRNRQSQYTLAKPPVIANATYKVPMQRTNLLDLNEDEDDSDEEELCSDYAPRMLTLRRDHNSDDDSDEEEPTIVNVNTIHHARSGSVTTRSIGYSETKFSVAIALPGELTTKEDLIDNSGFGDDVHEHDHDQQSETSSITHSLRNTPSPFPSLSPRPLSVVVSPDEWQPEVCENPDTFV